MLPPVETHANNYRDRQEYAYIEYFQELIQPVKQARERVISLLYYQCKQRNPNMVDVLALL